MKDSVLRSEPIPEVDVSHRPALRAGIYDFLKRILDIIFAVSFLVVFAPLILFIAALIVLEDRGPVFFVSKRIGKGGEPFPLLKFRTMRLSAETIAIPGTRAAFRLRDDPRITRIGAFLRRTGFDEMPGVVNVLRGDMSMVGPRAALPMDIFRYSDEAIQRLAVRPGLTGLWQVHRWHAKDDHTPSNFAEMVEMDIEYINKRSLWLDLKIMLLTVAVVARQEAFY